MFRNPYGAKCATTSTTVHDIYIYIYIYIHISCITFRTLNYGNYGIFLITVWVMQDLYHQPYVSHSSRSRSLRHVYHGRHEQRSVLRADCVLVILHLKTLNPKPLECTRMIPSPSRLTFYPNLISSVATRPVQEGTPTATCVHVSLQSAMDYRRVEPAFKPYACRMQVTFLGALALYATLRVAEIVTTSHLPPVVSTLIPWENPGVFLVCSDRVGTASLALAWTCV